jgi:dipeptidyl aminopeptidase/acylaminoacyl peptidase
MKRSCLCTCVVWMSLAVAVPAVDRTHSATIEDYFSLAAVTELAASPDGSHVAYCEGRWDKPTEGRRTSLWLVSTSGNTTPQRLTGDGANDRAQHWSADGSRVYCLANRRRAGEEDPPWDGTTQLWELSLPAGDPRPVTAVTGGGLP